jgi:hypothetical protein
MAAQIHDVHCILATMIKAILTFIVLAGLPGCNKTNQRHDVLITDKGLRDFLDVHSLNVSYNVPSGDTAYLLAILEFEDGKFSRRGLSSLGKVEELDARVLNAQLLWGTHEGKSNVALVRPGSTGKSDSAFWRNLDGGWGSCDTNTRRDEHDGFVILGFAQSDLDIKGRTNTAIYGDFRNALMEKKFLGAVAVKTFKTFEDAKRAAQP